MMAEASAAERAYQRLKADILSGAVAMGPLDLKRLGDRLRMSVTPVREALARLCAERLVRLAPHQGYAVASPSARRLENLYEFAGALCDLAAQGCAMILLAAPARSRLAIDTRTYAEGITGLHRHLASFQGNLELGEHLIAVSDRLLLARRCEETLFEDAGEELGALARLWEQANLAELRARLKNHYAARIARVDAVARLLAEQAGDC